MYVLFRARQLLGSVPALIALVLIALGIQSQTLKVEPVYDESAVELALVEPEPVPEPIVNDIDAQLENFRAPQFGLIGE